MAVKVSPWPFYVYVVIPVWRNEEISWVLGRFDAPIVDEVVVVLDEPNKKMVSLIKKNKKRMKPKLTILKNPKRMGIGYAIREGLMYGLKNNYDVVVVMAGNGKDDPREIPKLLEKIKEGYDYVQGSRFLDGGRYDGLPFQRRVFNRTWPIFWSLITGKRQTEVTNGFRAYKLSILKDPRININQRWLDGYALEYYVHYKVLALGYNHTEVPVSKIYRNKKNYTKINPLKDWHHIALPPILLRLGIRK